MGDLNDKADRETRRTRNGGAGAGGGTARKTRTGRDADAKIAKRKPGDAARKMREMFKG
ncbi:hypothetical protein [Actinomadura fibrosa]|uniref:CsbD family protein n=1 Tax=Actinomadura fibrosa TaxID=111802 RepID=A0ABW2XS79_9ACTN|nr:hypothetical protein [Actinomadura fibrosa]